MKTIQIPDDDAWPKVELYRWQHGHLPNAPGKPEQPLSVPAGLRGMADAIEKGDRSNFPTPMNVIEVLRYCARRLEVLDRAAPQQPTTGHASDCAVHNEPAYRVGPCDCGYGLIGTDAATGEEE